MMTWIIFGVCDGLAILVAVIYWYVNTSSDKKEVEDFDAWHS
jgi:hypothetical protein